MIEKKTEKTKHETKPRDDGVDLENQFILRLPEEPAKALHEALQTGTLKDRMTIKLDNELRYGELRFDQWLLHAKVLDLPTIIECLKTIDSKNFYKSADICQIMICKEEPDALDPEKESPNKGKKKDPNKVDKKYLWPHGITPPCKNVRKRRFRKTLKKKNVEAPEIEKEVKRLLRIDNDAVKVDFEIINEDLDKRSLEQQSKEYNEGEEEYNDETMHGGDKNNDSSSQKDINVESDGDDEDAPSRSAPIGGVGEHDIFGEEVSSSDDDEDMRRDTSRLRDLEDISRLSADDSRMSDFSMGGNGAGDVAGTSTNLMGASGIENANSMNSLKDNATEFDKSMFGSPKADADDMVSKFSGSNSNLAAPSGYYEEQKRNDYEDDYSSETNTTTPHINAEQIQSRVAELRRQYEDLKTQHTQKAQEISSIQNPTLKQRLQETLDNLQNQMDDKEAEIKDYENIL
ncbi:transcription initiation factor TFIID subunit 7 [Rhagoletis pomonella]|uniref:transcription initiation factor TFIID subunit 7 n=1 Tax=Rhagoletis pomonella TaxID=28610 RepID=UPI00177D5667|nr:transcription initiation factor TFIID subunit 7 [Rhagoletis pomonella]XP_036326342.1 transcription initiation factor TFIID subunit 7 [Rhagoletis pomonella]